MKILQAKQIKVVDQLTIMNEPIASIHLMERAAMACIRKLVKLITDEDDIYVVCGKGNNGGDGLAIARLLLNRGFDVRTVVLHHSETFSPDAQINYNTFNEKFPGKLVDIHNEEQFKGACQNKKAVVIDCILGSGINKPVDGFLGECIDYINLNFGKIISIDVPSGLFIDEPSGNNKHIVRSAITLSLHLPKLAFLMAENEMFVPNVELVNIGLDERAIEVQPTNNYFFTKKDAFSLLKRRSKFSHKGTYGHALLIAGSKGKAGAALISSKACMRSGPGLFTLHSIKEVNSSLLQTLPEAMSSEDENESIITSVNKTENFDAVGFGPGVGTSEETAQVLKKLLTYNVGNLVIDADGLNILSENKTWLNFLAPATILTPHPKEFERLAGKSSDSFERLELLRQFSIKHNCIVVLKGAYTSIAMPDGNVFFNSTGNAGLAKAGSGDALTGIILGLLSRGYNAPQAALIGTFVHGYAADLCAKKMSMESMLISDVIEQLPKAFKKLEDFENID